MSDFFTKKQRKYWCEKCRTFLEYTKISIEQHNKSKNHLRMLNADNNYYQNKKKIMKNIAYNYDVDNNPNYQIGYDQNFLQNKTERENNSTAYNYDSYYGYKNPDKSYYSTESSLMLEEIKKEKMKEILREKYNIKPKQQKEWGMFWDSTNNLPYYYNYITQKSQWEKPENFDGIEIKQDSSDMNECKSAKANEGVIGAWEQVKSEDSFFEKNKLKRRDNSTYIQNIPGEISKKEFYKLEYGIECFDSEEEDANTESVKSHDIKENYILNKLNPIDRIIIQEVDEKVEQKDLKSIKTTKDELIEFNKQMKKIDYDLKDVNQLYYNKDYDKNKEKEDSSTQNDTKNNFTISFNKVKKIDKKISSIFQQDEDDDQ